MTLELFKTKLQENPKHISFPDTMTVIDDNYKFTPTAFKNGNLENSVGQNSGSCKLFAFAISQGLTQNETLACFGKFYFDDVLKNPNGDGHQNIRNFINTGFKGLHFYGNPLLKI